MKQAPPSWLSHLACMSLALFLALGEFMPSNAWGDPDPASPGKQGGLHQPVQPAGKVDPSLLPLWAVLEGKAKGKITGFWRPGSGSPHTVYGVLSEAMRPSESSVRRFLSEHAQLFRLDSTLTDLFVTRQTESLIGSQFVFTQRHQGIPVYDGQIKILFDGEGRIRAVNNSYVPLTGIVDPIPLVTGGQAIEAGRMHLEKSQARSLSDEEAPSPIANLVVYAEDGIPTLAWEVIHHTWGPTWQVFINAKTGQVLKPAQDLNRYALPIQGVGQVFVTNAIVATGDPSLRDNKDAALVVPSSAYKTIGLERLSGTGYLEGAYASSSATKKRAYSPTHQFLFDRSSNGFSETMGYYFLDFAQQRIQDLGFTGVKSINARQQVFSVDRSPKDNSFYSVSSKEITFGIGGVDDAEDAEVIWHEYGHSIQDDLVDRFGTTAESGAMGEGFGDYWSGTLGEQYNTISLNGVPEKVCLAEWDSTTYRTGTPTCLRRLDGNKHYPEDMVGEVHDDGEMWSAALWLIRSALGIDKADRVILQHHILLPKDATFNMAGHALIETACSLRYPVSEMASILRARGFETNGTPFPDACQIP
ncbi:MAG: M36 family metallopeptidase [Nitrospira sp.]|nr:M36 family metallopeptidase [Nitrospira sp.]